ncbi:hypothetical protein DAPPUDRAFT_98218 [Daphnia pulex]|uniref:Uncharacterized protein n=1 Tax=Daphnia pulex TaxID=6669 RepID=E9G449_DAPPU|nr:hypothetical protein DAPPUDRAFT_98218 [Daphnia pulex]|eukprot:EFX85689.1 hypothetical protein DAPPUDRAFT_98218 [Daphnia pulex]
MVKEAVLECHTKCEKMAKIEQENERLLKELEKTKEMLTDVQEASDEMRACNESLFDQISHLEKDIEISSFEWKRDEGMHSHLLEKYERMRKNIGEMQDPKTDFKDKFERFEKDCSKADTRVQEAGSQITIGVYWSRFKRNQRKLKCKAEANASGTRTSRNSRIASLTEELRQFKESALSKTRLSIQSDWSEDMINLGKCLVELQSVLNRCQADHKVLMQEEEQL